MDRTVYDAMDAYPEIGFVLDRYADWISEQGHDWEEARDAAKYGCGDVPSVLLPAVAIWHLLVRWEDELLIKRVPRGALADLEPFSAEVTGEDVQYVLKKLYTALGVSEAVLVGDEDASQDVRHRRRTTAFHYAMEAV